MSLCFYFFECFDHPLSWQVLIKQNLTPYNFDDILITAERKKCLVPEDGIMRKIVIIGTGLGGLMFALRYKGDAQIEIYEACQRSELGFPWCDTIRLSSFTDNEIPVPSFALEEKKLFNISVLDGKGSIRQKKKLLKERAEIDRKELIEYMISQAESRAKIHFGKRVKEFIKKDDKICGIILESGEQIESDLVIDASGAFSEFRKYLPIDEKDFEPTPSETLYYYRGYYENNPDVDEVDYDSVYLKMLGENAISWVRTAPNKKIDVFIAHTENLSNTFLFRAFNDIQFRNERLSSTPIFVKRGKLAIRYPLSTLVFDGLALVGDSAYMSMPMTGSGMDNAIYSGAILAETINALGDKEFTKQNLWGYQSKYFRTQGHNMYACDLLLKYGFSINDEDLMWFFNEILIENNSAKDIIDKIKGFVGKKKMTISTVKILTYALRARTAVSLVPPIYNENLVKSWTKRYNDMIKNVEI